MRANITLSLLTLGIALLHFTPQASAYELEEINCYIEPCGIVSDLPKTVLVSVNPQPLPTVNQGDAQNVTVRWAVQFGLNAKFEFCVTSTRTSGPDKSDPCTDLPGAATVPNTLGATIYEDSLKLGANFYRSEAEFYIRTTSKFSLVVGGVPSTAASNRRAFTWPLTMPNLYSSNPDWDIVAGRVHIVHPVSNRGLAAAGPSVTELEVHICDGLAMLPLADPNDPRSDRICDDTNAFFVTTFTEHAPVNYLAAGASEQTETDINHHMPQADDHPYGLYISIRARVDVHNDIDESSENDNSRYQTVDFLF